MQVVEALDVAEDLETGLVARLEGVRMYALLLDRRHHRLGHRVVVRHAGAPIEARIPESRSDLPNASERY